MKLAEQLAGVYEVLADWLLAAKRECHDAMMRRDHAAAARAMVEIRDLTR